LDVYGYKISMHDCIASPEFIYLCVALNVEIHNRLLSWSQHANAGSKASLVALQAQLRSQHEAAQAVFTDFQRPLAGVPGGERASAKKAKRVAKSWGIGSTSVVRFAAACGLVLAALAGNLFVFGVVQLDRPPEVLSSDRVKDLSPLLLNARLTEGGKHLLGLVARPQWKRMTPRQRQTAAENFARALKARGIERADVLAYKARAIQVEFGSVVFVDDSQ
jgi:hypothetical protein